METSSDQSREHCSDLYRNSKFVGNSLNLITTYKLFDAGEAQTCVTVTLHSSLMLLGDRFRRSQLVVIRIYFLFTCASFLVLLRQKSGTW